MKNILFIFFFLQFGLHSQNIDSLQHALKTAKPDTNKLNLLFQLVEIGTDEKVWGAYNEKAYDLSLILAQSETESISKKGKKGLADALQNKGVICELHGDIEKALDYYNKGLKAFEDINDKGGVAEAFNSLGNIYGKEGNIQKALDVYEKSLKMREEIGDKKGIAYSLNNIGLIYTAQKEVVSALACHERSLKLFEELNYKTGISQSLNDIGLIYFNQHENVKALTYYERSLKIDEETDDKSSMGTELNNIGFIYERLGQFEKALEYFTGSLKVREEIGDKVGIAMALNSSAAIHLKMATGADKAKKHATALVFVNKSLALANELGFPKNIRNAQLTFSRVDSAMGNDRGAFEHYKYYIIYRDSINNEQTRKASIKSQLNYDFEKKEAVIKEQQEKERVVAQEKNRFQQIVIASVIFGLVLVIVFAFFIARSLKQTHAQKHLIEEKQREILDSIRYAKRIQSALLTHESYFERSLTRLQSNQ